MPEVSRSSDNLQDSTLLPAGGKRARIDMPYVHYDTNHAEMYAEMGLGLLGTDEKDDDSNVSLSTSECIFDDDDTSEIEKVKEEMIRATETWEEFCLYRRASMMKQGTKDWFNVLSDEIILMIFQWLPKTYLTRCALVSKRWQRLTADESLWTTLDCSGKIFKPGQLTHILMRQVMILKLATAQLYDPIILSDFQDFTCKLMYLDLSMAQLSTNGLTMLFHMCKHLRKVSLEACDISDSASAELARNENLEVLNLTMVRGLNAACLKHILQGCNKLKELNLAWTNLSVDALNILCISAPRSLLRLNLAGCRRTLTTYHVKLLVQSSPFLTELDLSDGTGLVNDTINSLITLKELNFLALSRCYQIQVEMLKLLKKLPALKYLDIHGSHIDENELKSLQKLQYLVQTFSTIARPTGLAYETFFNFGDQIVPDLHKEKRWYFDNELTLHSLDRVMAKGHRHLKKLKSEKAKVKLKGRKLPKDQNVTDTSFKVKQIVIREQLRAVADDEVLSKRKLNIKELLNRLQHYNITAKSSAINDLKDYISQHPQEILIPNLSQIVQGVCHLVLEKEKLVRRESLKLIALILSNTTVDQITPFFDIISSYFRCAMTHIDTAIQEDSLLLLDTLLLHIPSLIAQKANNIMENFFDLISKLRSDSKPGRTLTVNLNSKITTVKWRIKVLNRLYSLLNAILEDQVKSERFENNNIASNSFKYTENVPMYNFKYLTTSTININGASGLNKPEEDLNILKYIDTLVPLLFETWLEVGPGSNKNETSIAVTLTEEAKAILNCILNIIQLLYKCIINFQKDTASSNLLNKFISKYSKDFSNYIFIYFPYTQIVSRKRKRKEMKKQNFNLTNFCLYENLMICNLFIIFNKVILTSNKLPVRNHIKKLFHFTKSILKKWSSGTEEENKQVAIFLQSILLNCNWQEYFNERRSLLSITIDIYENKKTSETTHYNLFNILCDVIHIELFVGDTKFQQWICKLPELLLNAEISEKTVNMISLLAKRKNLLFLTSLKLHFYDIMLNVDQVVIKETDSELSVKLNIIGLIYYLPSNYICEVANKILRNEKIPFVFRKNLKEILLDKFQNNVKYYERIDKLLKKE